MTAPAAPRRHRASRLAALLLCALLLSPFLVAGAVPPHEKPPAPAHPRLFASPAELDALRAKVAGPGSVSKRIFDRAMAAVPPAGLPDFGTVLNATAPMASLLLPTPETRAAMARRAIDTALALVRKYDPPYPDDPEWVSWTHRNGNRNHFQSSGPPRADVFSWPPFIEGDAVLSGAFTIVAAAPGAALRIGARVRDRKYPDDAVDQDLVFVEVDPAKKKLALVLSAGGKEQALKTAAGVDLAPGGKHVYESAVRGDAVSFTLDGTPRLRATAKGLPPEGYCQWEVAAGLHVHLDDLSITPAR